LTCLVGISVGLRELINELVSVGADKPLAARGRASLSLEHWALWERQKGRVLRRGHEVHFRAPVLKSAALVDSRMMLSITGGALDLGSRVIVPPQSFFAEAATYDSDSGNRACVDEPDHRRDLTGQGVFGFRKAKPSPHTICNDGRHRSWWWLVRAPRAKRLSSDGRAFVFLRFALSVAANSAIETNAGSGCPYGR
jgi:hypothetical protein